MKENIKDLDDPDPDKYNIKISKRTKIELGIFDQEVIMISKFKRMILRKKLKKEKLVLLTDLFKISKKLRILDEADKKNEKV